MTDLMGVPQVTIRYRPRRLIGVDRLLTEETHSRMRKLGLGHELDVDVKLVATDPELLVEHAIDGPRNPLPHLRLRHPGNSVLRPQMHPNREILHPPTISGLQNPIVIGHRPLNTTQTDPGQVDTTQVDLRHATRH